MKTKPLDASAYIASPERAVALLNKVIASGGDLDAIKQAVGVVAGAGARFQRSCRAARRVPIFGMGREVRPTSGSGLIRASSCTSST